MNRPEKLAPSGRTAILCAVCGGASAHVFDKDGYAISACGDCGHRETAAARAPARFEWKTLEFERDIGGNGRAEAAVAMVHSNMDRIRIIELLFDSRSAMQSLTRLRQAASATRSKEPA